ENDGEVNLCGGTALWSKAGAYFDKGEIRTYMLVLMPDGRLIARWDENPTSPPNEYMRHRFMTDREAFDWLFERDPKWARSLFPHFEPR
ncbi:MAG TPA: hypothetical protein VL856_20820, partial [Acidimicrobiia bacterium]|nr:hypothetical protein [Acidimicrobiia bacterium]